jgi:HlyD family secretion protein
VAVNEADIGNIYPGQPVDFTVDAYPGQTFKGEVGKIRLNATMTQNVVTYTVEVLTDNSSGKLLPYLTANVQFELSRRENVLTVPNAALRWAPQPEQIAKEYRVDEASGNDSSGSSQKLSNDPNKHKKTGSKQGTVWVQDGEFVRPVTVKLGMTDGVLTEVFGNELPESTEIITGEQQQSAQSDGTTNPFTPKFRRH